MSLMYARCSGALTVFWGYRVPISPKAARLWRIARRVFIEGDTTTIRVLLAVASVGFTAGLWLPLHTFDRPGFAVMRAVMPEWAWGALFLLHAAGVAWRLIDPLPRVGWAFAVNAYGLFLWIVSTGLITSAVGEYSPGTAMEITVLLAAFVALIRTGLNDEQFTP